jgi:hypothetical protein
MEKVDFLVTSVWCSRDGNFKTRTFRLFIAQYIPDHQWHTAPIMRRSFNQTHPQACESVRGTAGLEFYLSRVEHPESDVTASNGSERRGRNLSDQIQNHRSNHFPF